MNNTKLEKLRTSYRNSSLYIVEWKIQSVGGSTKPQFRNTIAYWYFLCTPQSGTKL